VAYFDMAAERIEERDRGSFELAVEAARIGTAAAWSRDAASSWRSSRSRLRAKSSKPAEPGLTGEALEAAVMAIAMRDPGIVAMRTVA
jgi:hypothetical protein